MAVQSDFWVDKMNSSGWSGPVRFGDGREGDWDGHKGRLDGMESRENGGMEVWHAPGCTHGWTQFPSPFLGRHGKAERDLVFARTLEFVKEAWGNTLPVQRLGSRSDMSRPIRISSHFNGLQ